MKLLDICLEDARVKTTYLWAMPASRVSSIWLMTANRSSTWLNPFVSQFWRKAFCAEHSLNSLPSGTDDFHQRLRQFILLAINNLPGEFICPTFVSPVSSMNQTQADGFQPMRDNASRRSAVRSSMCSIPTETRMSCSVIPRSLRSLGESIAWEVNAGTVTR